MRTLRIGRGAGIAAALLALSLLCPASRGDDAPTPRGAWIGVSTRGLGNEWREREDYWARGVMIVEVTRGSAADQAGMGPGDVLVSIDSHTLETPGDLTEAERALEPGHAVPVVLARDGGRVIKIFNLEPGPLPDAIDSTVAPPARGADVAAATREPAVAATGAAVAATANAPAILRNGTPALGVRCENLSFDLAEALGALEGQGVLVVTVTGGSPADRAGIRAGDVITWVGNQSVADVGSLDGAVATAPSPVMVVTRRGETTRDVTVEFEAPAAASGDAAAQSDALATDPRVAALRDEVRSLRDEVEKLREEIAVLAKVTRQP